MRKKETKKHKEKIKRRYSNLRRKAKTILVKRYKKEYLKIIRKLNKRGENDKIK